MKRFLKASLAGLLLVGGARAQLPEVSEAAIEAFGSTYGSPQLNGFVFIEGRYLSPPYTVTRKGNGIFINRIQVEQVHARSLLAADATAGEPRKSVDADGDFEAIAPDAAKPAAPEAPAAPAAAPVPAAPKAVKSIDDLFADEDAPAAPKAEAPAPAPAAAPAPAQPAAVPSAAQAAPAAQAPGPEDLQRLREEFKTKLDALRKNYELALGRGEVFFFSERHSRLNGNYGTARTLLGVLPSALRNAQSPQDLLQRLNQGGVYFVDLGICSALFRNRMTFPLLDERLRRIEENEALDAARREQVRTR